MLEVKGITAIFGGVTALSAVSFGVEQGEFLGLIGPNGAGKTTVLNAISRLSTLADGDIEFEGASLLPMRPHEIIRRGIVRTYQNMALCPTMSVLANVMLGGLWRRPSSAFAEWLGTPAARQRSTEVERDAIEAMRAVGIVDAALARVDSLAHGMRRKVELARALCAHPRLILLDEPASGLSDQEAEELVALIRRFRSSLGLTMIVIEHHMDVVMALSDRIVVLDGGRVIAEGIPSAVAANPAVLEAYLGQPA
ncbi:MAG: ABC transporter ATP-binding protein [Betaproteobacteria bacterium]|nr:MAG: ABC transporter ATP-binding protein [Betaproteobacteria bacterium]